MTRQRSYACIYISSVNVLLILALGLAVSEGKRRGREAFVVLLATQAAREMATGGAAVREPAQEKKLAYLRDAGLWDLLPTEANKRLKEEEEPLLEGSAAPFLKEMLKGLHKPLDPQLKEQLLVREIKLFLETEWRGDLAKEIDSTRQFEMLPLDLRIRFEDKDWHFNDSNDVGGLDDYQLLCLGRRGKVDDPITDFCNKIGNTILSDSAFVPFCKIVFMKLLWNDTEYMGFQRALETNNLYPESFRMKSLLIPWMLNVWTTYKIEERKFERRIEQCCKLWTLVVDEKNEFSEALYDNIKRNLNPSSECDFKSVIKYVQQKMPEKKWKKPVYLIDEYFEKLRPMRRLDKGYTVYLKEKITKAMQLGIIKKEDEEDPCPLDRFFQTIEHTDLYSWDKDSWFQY